MSRRRDIIKEPESKILRKPANCPGCGFRHGAGAIFYKREDSSEYICAVCKMEERRLNIPARIK